jgi:hypothetical protein
MDSATFESFRTAICAWYVASVGQDAATVARYWQTVTSIATRCNIPLSKLGEVIARVINSARGDALIARMTSDPRFIQSLMNTLRAALATEIEGGVIGGGTAGAIGAAGLVAGGVVCVVASLALAGTYVAVKNRRDANNARAHSNWLYQQYLLRFAKFEIATIKRHPARRPSEPMGFPLWLQMQGSRVTVL